MKSYTDIEQSKVLAEILPLESADMFWYRDAVTKEANPRIMNYLQVPELQSMYYVPCWSLAALLNIMPDELQDNHYLTLEKEGEEYCCCYEDINGNSFKHTFADNPVDACVEMIELLHEQKLL